MEAEDKAGFTVQNKPEVVLLPLDLHHSFIGVPLVGVEIESGRSCMAMFWNMGAKRVHQLLTVVWDTRIFITVRKIRAMLRNEFLPR